MRGVCAAALLVALFCLALTSENAEAGRTHALFAQSTYNKPDGSSATPTTTAQETSGEKAEEPAVIPSADNLPVKTTTTPTTAEAADASTNNGQNQESSTSTAADSTIPPEEQEQQQRYRDFRSTTPASGDFTTDARPWWSNPTYANYGNYEQGNNLQQQQQQQLDPSAVVIPNRYPLGYPTRYYNPDPQAYYAQNSNPSGGAQYSAVPGSSGAYTSSSIFAQQQQQQQQYSQSRFPQYSSSVVPYEMTGGGCPTQYWISNTQRWPAFFNVKSTVGDALGTPAKNVFGDTTVLQALLNTRSDGYSTLLRSSSTAILNSYSRSQYKFSHVQVIESFASALGSSQAAAEQAAAFEEANVSAYSEQYNSCT